MPGITQLEIYDEPVTGRDKILGWHANSYLGLLSNLSERCMAPLKWEDYDYLGNEPVLKMADAASMRNLLVHLGTAGIRLTRLSIKTSAPRSFRGLECDADKQAALQTLAENLQYFHFWTGTQKENELRSHKALEAVNTFFSALNSSPKLRVSDVDFGGISRAGVNYHRFDPSLSKSLKKLVLRRVHIRALTLAKFFATLKAPLDLVMIGCRMVDGNWLHLMDTMKELADPAIPGGERLRLLAFKDLSGAEIDVLGRKRARKIFDEEHGRLAGKDGTKLSLAHAYILQKCNIVANPPTRKAIAELIDYD
ncbi:unnamed protein product [Colletotrichum noveboracense]|uniref:Uncharacterized protein n=1 Tax=Colletotrichum noveboracense TaxID=2664923 RepID=A0A9W4RT34_9PEZI|nr:hypothetical protein K456DRAFT_1722439 [Colletotrichum gloeosporioides 23]CAI0646219.1 unnamed protein product [Colletotrichum noveboracense]